MNSRARSPGRALTRARLLTRAALLSLSWSRPVACDPIAHRTPPRDRTATRRALRGRPGSRSATSASPSRSPTRPKQARGLGYRDDLAWGTGMYFPYDRPSRGCVLDEGHALPDRHRLDPRRAGSSTSRPTSRSCPERTARRCVRASRWMPCSRCRRAMRWPRVGAWAIPPNSRARATESPPNAARARSRDRPIASGAQGAVPSSRPPLSADEAGSVQSGNSARIDGPNRRGRGPRVSIPSTSCSA